MVIRFCNIIYILMSIILFGFGRANAEGRRVMDFAMSFFDLAIANTFFRKREEHYIAYKSEGNKAQIDFMMYRRSNLVEIKKAKLFPETM